MQIANWERLKRFTEDPRAPLDNNATERGIRGLVVGRRNHYASKSRRGTVAAATRLWRKDTIEIQ